MWQKDYERDIRWNKVTGDIRTHPASNTIHRKTQVDDKEEQEQTEEGVDILYVDATRMEDGTAAIIRIFKNELGENVEATRVENIGNIQQGEEVAIKEALQWRRDKIRLGTANRKAWVVSDSRTAIQKVRNGKIKTKRIMEIRRLLEDTNQEGYNTWVIWRSREKTNRIVPHMDGILRRAVQQRDPVLKVYKTKKDLREEKCRIAVEGWQQKWTAENINRPSEIGQIIPRVGLDMLDLTFKTTQLITGHGNMKHYIKRFRLQEIEEECECGHGPESHTHVIHECQSEERVVARLCMREYLISKGEGFPPRLIHRTEDKEKIEEVNRWGEASIRDP